MRGLKANSRRWCPKIKAQNYPFGMLMPGRYVSDTTERCMTITRSGWTTIMVDSCTPLIATASALYATGSATAVYNGSHLVFSAAREVDGAGFVAQVAAGIDNSFEFNVSKLASSSDEGVLVTVLETIDNVQYVIGGGRLQLGPKQRINFRSTGNNVSLLFTGPFNVVELSQVCTKYPKSVQHTYLVDVCDEDKDRYRFGFNGMEKDNELKGVGNSLDFGARMYDSRVARWLSLDPLAAKYPSQSSYNFALNSPIAKNDPNGKEAEVTITRNPNGGGTIRLSSTVFIHGADAATVVEASKKSFADWKNNGGVTSDGKWKVEIQMTFKVATDEDVTRISKQRNEESSENLMILSSSEGRANAGHKAGSNYLNATSKKIPNPHYKDRTMDLRTGTASGNKAYLFKGDLGHTTIHENLHLMGLGDRYSDNIQWTMTLVKNGVTTTSTVVQGSITHQGFDGDIMNHGWGFSQVHADNLTNEALKVAEEKGSDQFYMGRNVDNATNADDKAVPSKRTESGPNWEKTYTNPKYVGP